MACYYCNQRSVVNPDNGNCVDCSLAVCAAPPVRKDKKFHADQCRCRCRKLVCIYDAVTHAANHGSTVASCFPGSSLATAAGAIQTAIVEADAGRTAEHLEKGAVKAFNQFLNFVAPGHVELGKALKAHPEEIPFREKRRDPSSPERIPYEIGSGFFLEGAIDKLVSLAAVTAVRSWTFADDAFRDEIAPSSFSTSLVRELRESYAHEDTVTFSAEFLSAFVKPGGYVPPTIQRALTYTRLPTSPRGIADWFLDTPESTAVPMILA